MYKLETKNYPNVGEVVAICRLEDPRKVVAIAAVAGEQGWFNLAIDCGALFDNNNDDPKGDTFGEFQFELDGNIGWRHASIEEFNELVDVVNEEGKDWKELSYVVDREHLRLFTFNGSEDLENWLKRAADETPSSQEDSQDEL